MFRVSPRPPLDPQPTHRRSPTGYPDDDYDDGADRLITTVHRIGSGPESHAASLSHTIARGCPGACAAAHRARADSALGLVVSRAKVYPMVTVRGVRPAGS